MCVCVSVRLCVCVCAKEYVLPWGRQLSHELLLADRYTLPAHPTTVATTDGHAAALELQQPLLFHGQLLLQGQRRLVVVRAAIHPTCAATALGRRGPQWKRRCSRITKGCGMTHVALIQIE